MNSTTPLDWEEYILPKELKKFFILNNNGSSLISKPIDIIADADKPSPPWDSFTRNRFEFNDKRSVTFYKTANPIRI